MLVFRSLWPPINSTSLNVGRLPTLPHVCFLALLASLHSCSIAYPWNSELGLLHRPHYLNSSFDQVDTFFFWVIDSLYKFTLNLPSHIHNLFIADITRCYETIPLFGNDCLPDAITHVTKISYSHHNATRRHPNSLWLHINLTSGLADFAKWSRQAHGFVMLD